MDRSIVITGASKGIGRAAAYALVEDGWSVIGAARSSPTNFPEVFIEADLADREKTQVLADDLLGRGSAVGIVNNVGLARHERGRIINITSLVTAGLAFRGSYAAAFITGQTLFVDGGASFGTL
jgi:3-oxoacyl-[acyl-carrier protein] reductase